MLLLSLSEGALNDGKGSERGEEEEGKWANCFEGRRLQRETEGERAREDHEQPIDA